MDIVICVPFLVRTCGVIPLMRLKRPYGQRQNLDKRQADF